MHRTIPFSALALIASVSVATPVDDRALARALMQKENWPSAEAAFRALIAANPHRGSDHYFLAEALARQGDCAAALSIVERAIALGVDGTRSGLRLAHIGAARCAAATGQTDRALSHLSVAQAHYGFSDFATLAAEPAFAKVAHHPHFKRLAGQAEPGLDRVSAWRSDLSFFSDLLRRRHRNPFHIINEDAWMKAATELDAQIPQLDDTVIISRFMRLAAMIGDGHTTIFPPLEGARAFHLLPIWPYRVDGKWYIVAAAPIHGDLVGAEIIAIAGTPMAKVEERMRALLPADNERTIGFFGVTALQFFEIGALATETALRGALSLEIAEPNGARRVVHLDAGPLDRDPTAAWAPREWPSVTGANRPLWLAHADTHFYMEALDDGQTLYAQINKIADGPQQTVAQFAAALGRQLGSAQVRRLILDLRHNNGGNGLLNWTIVREIVRSDRVSQRGALFVITGPRTFSAGMSLASMLETHAGPIFVGEPTGSRPNFYGEDTPFTLPHSRLSGSISSAWFQGGTSSDDLRPFIAPELPAPVTADALRNGRDPALAVIAEYVAEHR
jgi:tetratricopeptide (TPR) repeat protein